MTEEYERYVTVYEKIRKAVKTFPSAIPKEDIFKQTESLGIKIKPSEERSFFDGLERYFRKFKIITVETEILKGSRKGESVISFKKMPDEEEKYIEYFDIYKILGPLLNKYIEQHYEYAIDINDIITYANKIPKDIKKAPTGEFFLKGLELYLSDLADIYLPPEAKRTGIEMEIKPLISMETGKRIGNIAVFRETR